MINRNNCLLSSMNNYLLIVLFIVLFTCLLFYSTCGFLDPFFLLLCVLELFSTSLSGLITNNPDGFFKKSLVSPSRVYLEIRINLAQFSDFGYFEQLSFGGVTGEDFVREEMKRVVSKIKASTPDLDIFKIEDATLRLIIYGGRSSRLLLNKWFMQIKERHRYISVFSTLDSFIFAIIWRGFYGDNAYTKGGIMRTLRWFKDWVGPLKISIGLLEWV